jgi:hypothetical protein
VSWVESHTARYIMLNIGTVGHVLKLFAHDKDGHKDKAKDQAKLPERSATRESHCQCSGPFATMYRN